MRVKMSKPPPHAPTASAIGPCPTVIKIVGRPGTGSSPSTIAPPDHRDEPCVISRNNVILIRLLPCFSSVYRREKHEYMFLSLEGAASSSNGGSLLKERICSYRSKFFPGRGDPCENRGKERENSRIALFESISIHLNMLTVADLLF